MASVLVTRSLLARLARARLEYPSAPSSYQQYEDELNVDCKSSQSLATALVCRVCAGSGCTPLTERLAGDVDIMSGIRMITDITISVDDNHPKFICAECLTPLKAAMEFRRKCEQTDKRFRKMTNPFGESVTTYPYSKHDFQLMLHQMKLKRHKASEERQKEIIKQEKKQRKKLKKKKGKRKTREKRFTCVPCKLHFSDKNKLQAHRGLRQCIRHPCDICGQPVLSIAQHMRIIHKQDNVHKCQTCGKEFPIIARLRSHMLVHTDTFNFYCDLCPYKSKHKYYLVMHMRTHTGEKPYKCASCDATFVNPSNLNKHKLTHKEKQFQCNMCEKSFRTKVALREHHEAAHMNLKHTCNYCGRHFCYKSDLRKHEIRYHNRVKRNYVGGEPTYKQVERMQKMQTEEPHDIEKWTEVPVMAPIISQFGAHTVYTYAPSDTLIHQHTLVSVPQPPAAMPVLQTNDDILMPDLSQKKDDSKLYAAHTSMGFF